MASKIIPILDIVSGNIENDGTDMEQDNRLRAEGYIKLPMPSPSELIVEINSISGKAVDVEVRGYRSDSQNVATVDKYWYTSPAELDLSSTAGINFIRLVFRYSDNSKINPEEIQSCQVITQDCWHIGTDGYPTNDNFPELPLKAIKQPYPDAYWRIDSQVNDGYPYHELLPVITAPVIPGEYKFIYNGKTINNIYVNGNLISKVIYPNN